MKLAIGNNKNGFHSRWEQYCVANNISYKLVDCYSNELVEQIKDCKALMWHFSQNKAKDIIIAKEILYALQHYGIKVFPDYRTAWHFDDKLGQKYLLEMLDIPFVKTYAFYNKETALKWADETKYPIVFKLRRGAGSANVKLIKSKKQCFKIIKKAFGKGFRQYDKFTNLEDRWKKYRARKTNIYDVFKGIVRLGYEPEYSKTIGYERGYTLFQDFIPNNSYDVRVIVIVDKAFAIKRMVRKNDFRASGSGFIKYEKENITDEIIKLSFKINEKIKSQSLAIDYVFDNGKPLVIEISYGFIKEVYDPCVGYWDKDLNWFEGKFNPYGWMVENLIKQIS